MSLKHYQEEGYTSIKQCVKDDHLSSMTTTTPDLH